MTISSENVTFVGKRKEEGGNLQKMRLNSVWLNYKSSFPEGISRSCTDLRPISVFHMCSSTLFSGLYFSICFIVTVYKSKKRSL